MNQETKTALQEQINKLQEQLNAGGDGATKAVTLDDVKAAAKAAAEEAMKARGDTTEDTFQVPNASPAKFADAWKYDNLDRGTLAFGIGVLNAAKAAGATHGGRIIAPSDAMVKALAIRLVGEEDKDRQFSHARQAMKAAGMAMKANELNQSTLASYGDEWVGVAYSSQLWEAIRQDSPIVGQIPTMEIPQGMESVVIPIEGTPPTFYKVAQASAQAANPGATTHTVPTSRYGTTNQTLSVGKLGAATTWTGELSEDSVVAFAEELRRAIQQEGAEVLEHVVIDGDTATTVSTNINDIAGTPAGTEAFLLFNGFRKLCLVTNTANSRSVATLSEDSYLETAKLLGVAGRNALNKGAVAFITDLPTHWATLALTNIKSQEYNPAAPVMQDGMLTRLWGYRVFATANMHRANQDATYGLKSDAVGKLDLDTAADNTKGAILAVRFDQWRLGWKRRMTIELERVPRADAYEITALMRVGMVNRDTEASAINYNLTI